MENTKKLYIPIEFRFGGLYESSTSFKLPTQAAGTEPAYKIPLISHWTKIMNIGPGLRNLGNTCFFNSVLQCLTYSAPLANYFLNPKAHSSEKCNKEKTHCWLCLLSNHFKHVFGSNSKVLSPVDIIKCLRGAWKKFKLGSQEDSHEFLRIFLDNVQKAEKWLINGIYAGKLKNQVQCLECKAVSEKSEPFMDLSLEVQKSDSIQKSLEIFFKKESLSGNNKYRCGKCKKLVNAWKGFELEEGPMILTIHLKRFNNNLMKLNKFVKFTEKLELRQFARESKKSLPYELFAVVVHQGSQMWSGHYYSYVKNSNNMWYLMNDETVRLANLEKVLKEHAYILFYARKDTAQYTNNLNHNDGVFNINGNEEISTYHQNSKSQNQIPNENQIPNGNNVTKKNEEKTSPILFQQKHFTPININGVKKNENAQLLSFEKINNNNLLNPKENKEESKNALTTENEDYSKRLSKLKESLECRTYLDSIFKKTLKKENIQINGKMQIENHPKAQEMNENQNKITGVEKELNNSNTKTITEDILMNGVVSLKRSKLKKLKKMANFVVKKRKINGDAIKICFSDEKLAKIKSIDEIFESKILENDDIELTNSALLNGKRMILEKNPEVFEKNTKIKDAYDVEYDKGKLKKKKIKREQKKNDFQKALEQKNYMIRKY